MLPARANVNARAARRTRPAWVGIALVLAAFLATAAEPADQPTGLEIMKKQRSLHKVRDEQHVARMRIVSKLGAEKLRTLATYNLNTDADRHKGLMRFTSPRDIENTGLLVWEAADGDDDQWLYLPASQKVKRVPSSSKKNRFMGTDFAYEDMRPESLALNAYTLVRSEAFEGQDTFVVEARPATPEHARDSGYGLRRMWLDKTHYLTLRVEYYDKAGKLLKVQTPRQFINLTGTVWRPNETEMRDVQAGTRTIMAVEQRRLNTGLKESLFTELELTRSGG